MVTVCKGCGKPINWIRAHGRKKMPVDTETVSFVADRSGTEIFVRKDSPDGRAIGRYRKGVSA